MKLLYSSIIVLFYKALYTSSEVYYDIFLPCFFIEFETLENRIGDDTEEELIGRELRLAEKGKIILRVENRIRKINHEKSQRKNKFFKHA